MTKKDEFIKKAILKHGNVYDYSKVTYKNCSTKVEILCPEHGVFWQTPSNHLYGYKCYKCSRKTSRLNERTKSFVEKASKVHNDKYKYDKMLYVNLTTAIDITCKQHGVFRQSPINHLKSIGCLKCVLEKSRKTFQEFVSDANVIHNHKYSYSIYIDTKTKIPILCPIHGEFYQTPRNHQKGHGCLKCGSEKLSKFKLSNTNSFIIKSSKIHNNKYSYGKTIYVDAHTRLIITCPIHGDFTQLPHNHIHGNGCPNCICQISKQELEIVNFLRENGVESIDTNRKDIIHPYEIDIFIQSKNLGIEHHGLYWHSYNELETPQQKLRHHQKHDLCAQKNIKLFQIFENEWIYKKSIIQSMILNSIGKSTRIHARSCSVVDLTTNDYRKFINDNHLQGYKTASIKLGLVYNNDIVACMSFNKHPKYEWEINRLASKLGCRVAGGPSKLLFHFITKTAPTQIMTYADRRFSTGGVYKKLGFTLDGVTPPNYHYVSGNHLLSRQQFQKHKLPNKLPIFNKNKSESENMFVNGYRRIWDAGHYRFVWSQQSAKP